MIFPVEVCVTTEDMVTAAAEMLRGFVYAVLGIHGAGSTALAGVRCLAHYLVLPVIVASVLFLCKLQTSTDNRI